MIELRGLEFRYQQSSFALQLQDLVLAPGEHAALVGPSGCGKTSLLNIMAGILQPHTGEVRVANQLINDLPDAERRDFRIRKLGLVFQNFELLDYLTVQDNVLLPLRVNYQVQGREEDGRWVDLGGPSSSEQEHHSQAWELPTSERWPLGPYRIKIEVYDADGKLVTREVPFELIDPDEVQSPEELPPPSNDSKRAR